MIFQEFLDIKTEKIKEEVGPGRGDRDPLIMHCMASS